MEIKLIGKAAKKASVKVAQLSTEEKNRVLLKAADALLENRESILNINKKDVENAVANGVKQAFIDRLTLTEKRLEDMAKGLREIAALNDPVGEYVYGKTLPKWIDYSTKKEFPLVL